MPSNVQIARGLFRFCFTLALTVAILAGRTLYLHDHSLSYLVIVLLMFGALQTCIVLWHPAFGD